MALSLALPLAIALTVNLFTAPFAQCSPANINSTPITDNQSTPARNQTETKSVGYFGAELSRNVVLRVRRYSPAGAAGLADQDVIKSIDNIDVSNLDSADILFLLQGRAGDTSELKVRRDERTLSLLLKRTECPEKFVPEGLNADQYWILGTQMLDMGWPDAARQALQKIVEEKPNSALAKKAKRTIATELPISDPPPRALQLNNKAWNLCHLGHSAEAQALLEECIKDYPAFEWPYQNLSTIQAEQGLTSNAESTTRILLEKNPKDVASWCNLASFQIQQGNNQAALKSYKVAHNLDPENERVTLLAQWLKEHKL
ncbi:hypothetical protein BH11CYA1_BH11CYA1_36350 [soil metagenome]